MINMDSQIPNKVVKEWIEQGNLFENVTLIRPETVYKILVLTCMWKRKIKTGESERFLLRSKV